MDDEHNGIFDKCKQIFLTQKEHGEYMTKVEKRFGEFEARQIGYEKVASNNQKLLIGTATGIILLLLTELARFFIR